MAERRIKALLFDLGDTLVDFGKVDTSRLFKQGARLSYDFLKGLGQPVGSFWYYCWRNLWSLRFHYWISNITGRDFDALELSKQVGAKWGIRLDEQQWRRLAWLWYKPLGEIGRLAPDAMATLERLRRRGLKLGIVSNTFVNGNSLDRHLQQLGILDFFSVRIYSYEFAFRKPDLGIFKAAAERVGEMVGDIVFVGDRIDKDIEPALRLGMRAVLKKAYTNEGKDAPEGTWKIERLSELPAIIDRINAGA